MKYIVASLFWYYRNLLWFFWKPKSRAQFWYEDNNLGKNGGYPKDFLTKFETPEWEVSSSKINVYQIGLVTLRQFPESFLTQVFVPYLNHYNIAIALDVEGATWMHLNRGREALFALEAAQIARLAELGVPVKYVTLQSPLCKATPNKEVYILLQRLRDVVEYKKMVRTHFPQAKIGIIDANPSHKRDWYFIYSNLLALTSIDYIHLDAPYSGYVKSAWDALMWYEINKIKTFCRIRDVEFGLLLTSEAGKISNTAFKADVLQMARESVKYLGMDVTGILISWFAYPDNTVPLISDMIKQIRAENYG